MLHSMTGFASESGSDGALTWTLDVRGVNAKGLDIRVRVPERMIGLDQKIRALFQKALGRGSLTISLRYEEAVGEESLAVNVGVLHSYIATAQTVSDLAREKGMALAPMRASDFFAMRGVLGAAEDAAGLPQEDMVLETAKTALNAFIEMRAREGSVLGFVLEANLQAISDLVVQAASLADARKEDVAATLRKNLATVLDNSEGADPARVAQELALLAVKADVTEEIDRLNAHIAAARDLLAREGPVGRKLDFLIQEFNREANTLCSKSGSTELTQVGLDMKVLIDQMREQVQNVE